MFFLCKYFSREMKPVQNGNSYSDELKDFLKLLLAKKMSERIIDICSFRKHKWMNIGGEYC